MQARLLPRMTASGSYVTLGTNNNRLLVFVHGFAGDPVASWGNFIQLLAQEADLNQWDFLSFRHGTRANLPLVSTQLATELATEWANYRQIAFVTHSTGGLIVQLALVDHPDLAERVSHAFFFAPANLGLRIDTIAKSAKLPLAFGSLLKYAAPQLEGLRPGAPFLRQLNERWSTSFGQGAPFRYWVIAGVDDTVALYESLTAVSADHRLAIPGTHISIIKPQSATDPAVQVVRNGLLQQALPTHAKNAAEPAVALKEKIDRGIVDVFLQCSRADLEEVRELALRLTQLSLRPFLLEDALPGRKWRQVLAERINDIRSLSACIGKHGVADAADHRDDIVEMFAARSVPVIPTILRTCPDGQSELSGTLREFIPVDFRDEGSNPLDLLVAGITGRKPAQFPIRLSPRRRTRKLRLTRKAAFAGAAILAAILLTWQLSGIPGGSLPARVLEARKANFTDPQYLQPETDQAAPSTNNATLLLFIHGIFGDTVDTWNRGDRRTSLPALILERPEFSRGFDAFAFGYTTAMIKAGSFQISDAATALLTEVYFRNFSVKYDRIVIVAHSMGGLVALEALSQDDRLRAHVPLIVTFATPYNGAQVSVLASKVLNNPALSDMLPADNSFLDSLNNRWTRIRDGNGPKTRVICAYEKTTIPGIGLVVPPQSARALCDSVADPISEDHIGIVKPTGPEHSSIKVLTNALRSLTAEGAHAPMPIPSADRTISIAERMIEADRLFDAGDYQNAAIRYDEILRIDPTRSNIRLSLGAAYEGLYSPAKKGDIINDNFLASAAKAYEGAVGTADANAHGQALERLAVLYGPEKLNDSAKRQRIDRLLATAGDSRRKVR